MMHIYAFGSICRGEMDQGSDVDLLACGEDISAFDTNKFSVYTYNRINELWVEGNPFAWHLHLEARIIYSSDGEDFIKKIGKPKKYRKSHEDFDKFKSLFDKSYQALLNEPSSSTFHLSCIFLSLRNFATCYSLINSEPVFSRRSPLMISQPLDISLHAFSILERARILSTRGVGNSIIPQEIDCVLNEIKVVPSWMEVLRNGK